MKKKKKRKKKSKFCKIRNSSIVLLGILTFVLVILLGYRINAKDFSKDESGIYIQASTNKEDYTKVETLDLIMVGDALFHSAVYGDAKTSNGYDFSPMFEQVKDMFTGYDLLFYNQESILGGTALGLSTYPCFNSPYEAGDAFREMGFNLVSLANNHTLDRGEKAIINSKNYWNQFEHIITAGSYKSKEEQENIPILEKNGITYALLAYTDTTNGLKTPSGKDYLVNRYNKEQVKEDIEKIRDKVDLLMVSMHFGVEYSHTPSTRQKEIAAYLESLGVDIIIGHHPHVVQPIEFINDTMVIYSLGNFISAQRGVEKLTGLVASVTVKKTTKGEESTLTLEEPTAELVYTSSKYASNGGRYDFKLYRYSDLTDKILPNYKTYKEKYLNIVKGNNENIKTR